MHRFILSLLMTKIKLFFVGAYQSISKLLNRQIMPQIKFDDWLNSAFEHHKFSLIFITTAVWFYTFTVFCQTINESFNLYVTGLKMVTLFILMYMLIMLAALTYILYKSIPYMLMLIQSLLEQNNLRKLKITVIIGLLLVFSYFVYIIYHLFYFYEISHDNLLISFLTITTYVLIMSIFLLYHCLGEETISSEGAGNIIDKVSIKKKRRSRKINKAEEPTVQKKQSSLYPYID